MSADAPIWQPAWTLEERLRIALVPASLHLRYRAARERRRGEREYRRVPELVDPRRTAVDVGANKGVWAYALARLAPAVHAFEPNPKIFPELRRALGGRVSVYELALSDAAGLAEFRVPLGRRGYSNQRGSLSAVAVNGDYAVTQVRTARLDDLGIADVGFIKIDVEGAEFAVLDGARETLARDRPTLLIELEESRGGRSLEAMIADVEARGYAGSALVDGAWRPCGQIDFDARHRAVARDEDYLFNFLFRPA